MTERIEKLLENIKPGITKNASNAYIDDGVLDSLDVMNLIVAIEDEFSIEIDPEDVITDNFQTIQAMSCLLRKYVGE